MPFFTRFAICSDSPCGQQATLAAALLIGAENSTVSLPVGVSLLPVAIYKPKALTRRHDPARRSHARIHLRSTGIVWLRIFAARRFRHHAMEAGRPSAGYLHSSD